MCTVPAGQMPLCPERCHCGTQSPPTLVGGRAGCAGVLSMSIQALVEAMSLLMPFPCKLQMLPPVPLIWRRRGQHGGQRRALRASCGRGREGPHAATGSAGRQLQRRHVALEGAMALRPSAGSAR